MRTNKPCTGTVVVGCDSPWQTATLGCNAQAKEAGTVLIPRVQQWLNALFRGYLADETVYTIVDAYVLGVMWRARDVADMHNIVFRSRDVLQILE